MPQKKFQTLLESAIEENRENDFDTIIYYRCATDVELFSRIFFKHYCKHPFNEFHYDTFASYNFRERCIREAKCAPRGYAKSTIDALIKPIHDICYCLEKFIVIGSNTDSQSIQKLRDIKTELYTNDDLIQLYGNLLPTKRCADADFICDNNGFKIRMLAVGSKTEIRGIRFGESRPSKIVLDDIEHSTEVENEEIREKYERWYQDVIKKIGDEQTNIVVVGTILHKKSLLAGILKNPSFRTSEYKAVISWAKNKKLWKKWEGVYCDIDNKDRVQEALAFYQANEKKMMEGVKVLWPEKEPYYNLMIEIIEDGIRSFMKEKQNSPMDDEEKVFRRENFQMFRETEYGVEIIKTGVIVPWDELQPIGVIDPATGQTKPSKSKKPDFTCLLTGYKQSNGRLFVFEDYTKRTPPTIYIDKIFDLFEIFAYEKFGVEINLYRNLLLPNIIAEKKRRERKHKKIIKLPFYDIEQTENKHKRIYTLEPKIAHGWIMFNETLSDEYFDQFFDFPKASHDDCPDATEMLWSLSENRYTISELSKSVIDR
jgi:predicted phage terminase large subunit-like protein